MNVIKGNTNDPAAQAIQGINSLLYQRNQAYAFIILQGLSHKFVEFIEEKQCEQVTNEELAMLMKSHARKKK